MIITRKIEVYVCESDKDKRKNCYEKLYDNRNVAVKCANMCVSHLFAIDNSMPYLSQEDKEKIMSHGLRKTVRKIIDYLRIVYFFLLIDILGAIFAWYNLPYCAILATLGVLLIEGRSVIENSKKKKSAAGRVVDAVQEIISCVDSEKAKSIIEMLKEEPKRVINNKE